MRDQRRDDARALVERLYAYRREALRKLLEHVSTDTLMKLVDGLDALEVEVNAREQITEHV